MNQLTQNKLYKANFTKHLLQIVLREFQGCSKIVLSVFPKNCKGYASIFQGGSMRVYGSLKVI